jgi:hypothetical protein
VDRDQDHGNDDQVTILDDSRSDSLLFGGRWGVQICTVLSSTEEAGSGTGCFLMSLLCAMQLIPNIATSKQSLNAMH